MGYANLRKFLADDSIHTLSGTVVKPPGEDKHYFVNDEHNLVVHVETHHHSVPVIANLSNGHGVWSVPDIGAEVLLASDMGNFEGELYVIGHYGYTNVSHATAPPGLSPQQHNVYVSGDINLVVGPGSKIHATTSSVTQPTVMGQTYRTAEDALLTQLNTLLIAINTYVGGIKAVADPSNAATPLLVTALTVMETAIATFKSAGSSYLTTVLEVE